jgi:hypothetical protein
VVELSDEAVEAVVENFDTGRTEDSVAPALEGHDTQ